MEVIIAFVFFALALVAALMGRVLAVRSQERIEMARLQFERNEAKGEAFTKDLAEWRHGVDHQLVRLQNQVDMLKSAQAQKRTISGLRS